MILFGPPLWSQKRKVFLSKYFYSFREFFTSSMLLLIRIFILIQSIEATTKATSMLRVSTFAYQSTLKNHQLVIEIL